MAISEADFCHLHVHTDKSLLDGISTPDELAQKAHSLGHRALAITDHGNLYGIIEFYETCKSRDIKPVIGCEFYFSDDEGAQPSRESYHITIFAKNNEGLVNLYKLSSYSYLYNFYYKPRINKKALLEFKDNLIVTSGCPSSLINRLIQREDLRRAEDEFRWFLSVFGEDFYIELHDHGLKHEHKANKILLEWSKKYSVKCIAVNDVHYANHGEHIVQDIVSAINSKTTIRDKNRFRITDDNGNLLDNLYYKSAAEMLALPTFRENPTSLKNTLEIVEKCNVKIDKVNNLYPKLYENSDSVLREKVISLLLRKYGVDSVDKLSSEVLERIEYELSVISSLGYSSYFLIVSDIVEYARTNKILVGPGRGSAAGSLVSYALNITSINPLDYGLLFERFLNPERVSAPDIDIDFEHEMRDDIIRYIIDRYGEDKVAKIITFSTMQLKNAVRDVLRVYDVPPSKINEISKQIDSKDHDISHVEKIISESKVLSTIDLKNAILAISKLVSKTRHTGIHASGIAVSPLTMDNIVPVATVSEEDVSGSSSSSGSLKRTKVTQFDMRDLEKVGLLKIDVLGLSTLTIIKNCLRDAGATHVDIYNLDVNDKSVYEIFSKGLTKGIFQFEGEGITKYLVKLQPDCIQDLIAINALYRPGPLSYIDEYIDRKFGRKPVEYLHPALRDILYETHGIIVYQEQIMQVARALAGFSLSKADEFRRGIGKKETEKILKNKEAFIEGCKRNNISEDLAERIFNDILKFAEYGFNKSHAAAYAYLAYVTAYLKKYYPLQFYNALLNDYINDHDELFKIIAEAKHLNMNIRYVDINLSEEKFSIKNGEIVAGLASIKNVRTDSIRKILEERNRGGIFISFEDFINRCRGLAIDRKTYEGIIYSGALNELIQKSGMSLLIAAHPDNIEIAHNELSKKKNVDSTPSLFDDIIESSRMIKLDNSKSISTIEYIAKRAEFFSLNILSEFVPETLLSKVREANDKIRSTELLKEINQNNYFDIVYCNDKNTRLSKKMNNYYVYVLYGFDNIIEAISSDSGMVKHNLYLVWLERNENNSHFLRRFSKINHELLEENISQIDSWVSDLIKLSSERSSRGKVSPQEHTQAHSSGTTSSRISSSDEPKKHANEHGHGKKHNDEYSGAHSDAESHSVVEETYNKEIIKLLDSIVFYEHYNTGFMDLFTKELNYYHIDPIYSTVLSITAAAEQLKKFKKSEVLGELDSVIDYFQEKEDLETVKRIKSARVYLNYVLDDDLSDNMS